MVGPDWNEGVWMYVESGNKVCKMRCCGGRVPSVSTLMEGAGMSAILLAISGGMDESQDSPVGMVFTVSLGSTSGVDLVCLSPGRLHGCYKVQEPTQSA